MTVVVQRLGSVHEIVESYCAEIRRVQPTGPYFLLGYSIGGAVAFEIARLLSDSHEPVGVVVLVDAICPTASAKVEKRPAGQRLARGLAKGGVLRAQLGRLWVRPRYLLAQYLVRRGRVVPRHLRENYVAHSLELIFTPHRPRPYSGKVILFRASEEETGLGLDPELGWSGLAAEGVEVCYGGGTHDTIIRSPNVSRLADRLRSLLQDDVGPAGTIPVRQSLQ